jgi:amidophosphoribosyltransferase
MTGDGWAFATRDPHGIRPGFYYIDDDVVVVASERPAIQAAFDVPPEAVKELPRGEVLTVSPKGEVQMTEICSPKPSQRACVFERIYFSRANDADIHHERKALGAALVPQILKAADSPLEDIFFSYIPNSARIAFHGMLERLLSLGALRLLRSSHFVLTQPDACGAGESRGVSEFRSSGETISPNLQDSKTPSNDSNIIIPRFGEVAVKDAKFRTFIADAAARREFYKHVYDVTYGLVRPGRDTLVVLDDSIVRGNTMKNAILPMLDRLGPKRIIVASSAPPIRYPDCYGIDMSTLDELVAFRALVNLLGGRDRLLSLLGVTEFRSSGSESKNPLANLYDRFTDEQHCAEIARLLTPPGMKAEVKVVYQAVEALHAACPGSSGDWYFTGDYPTPGGYKVLRKALSNYLARSSERSY